MKDGKLLEKCLSTRFWPKYFADDSACKFSEEKNLAMPPICWTMYPEDLSEELDGKEETTPENIEKAFTSYLMRSLKNSVSCMPSKITELAD